MPQVGTFGSQKMRAFRSQLTPADSPVPRTGWSWLGLTQDEEGRTVRDLRRDTVACSSTGRKFFGISFAIELAQDLDGSG